jgi:polysaccharide export outer membrane protein
MTNRRTLLVCSVQLAVSVLALAQAPQGAGQNTPPNPAQSINSVRPDYELAPSDQILIGVPESEEINQRPFRIDAEGFINIGALGIGRIRAAGLTVRALEAELTTRLREYIRDPHVNITVTQFRNEPVIFSGAFRTPGFYALQGGRTLVEMLAVVGGMQPNASRRIKITRRSEYGPIPLPNAVEDPARKVSSVEISLDSLTTNVNPAEDIILMAYDIVSAELAQPVYVNGEVTKPSAIALGDQPSISVMQALTQAGGLTQAANRGKIRILRPILGTSRLAVIEVDLNRVTTGKDNDVPLLPNDVLYVPRDSARAFLVPVGSAMLTTLPYLIVTLAVSGVL